MVQEVPLVEHVRPPGIAVTTYFVTLRPPADRGGDHCTRAPLPFSDARGPKTAVGTATSFAGLEAADEELAPTRLKATTVKV